MTRTGFYGERLGLALAEFAPGSGQQVGLPNIPPNWGPTSWLVMGSGGMSSTLEDMERYYDAIAMGKLLTGTWARWQQVASLSLGGSDRGFFILHATNMKGTSLLILTNREGQPESTEAMTRAARRLVLGSS